MFGYDQGVLSSLLTLPSFVETFPETGSGFGYAQSLLVAVCEFTVAFDKSTLIVRSIGLYGRRTA